MIKSSALSTPTPSLRPNKQLIASSFSKASAQYNTLACVQQRIVQTLFPEHLKSFRDANVLDLGCGSGQLLSLFEQVEHANHLLGMDIATGMLTQAQQALTRGTFIGGDAEMIPLRDEQMDIVLSSMALQWVHQPQRCVDEIKRVLKPGGEAWLAIMIPPSFTLLKAAFCRAGVTFNGVNLPCLAQWQRAFNFTDVQVENRPDCGITTHEFNQDFTSLRALLHSIKGVGAAVSERRVAPLSKTDLSAITHAYQGQFRLDYHVAFIRYRKPQ